jgi:hypothetical protein
LESINAEVLKAVYGEDNVDTDGEDIVIRKNSKKMKRRTWCIDSIDSELEAHYRDWIPQGQIISVGDITKVHSDIIQYEVELEAFEDTSGNNVISWVHMGLAATEVVGDYGTG